MKYHYKPQLFMKYHYEPQLFMKYHYEPQLFMKYHYEPLLQEPNRFIGYLIIIKLQIRLKLLYSLC